MTQKECTQTIAVESKERLICLFYSSLVILVPIFVHIARSQSNSHYPTSLAMGGYLPTYLSASANTLTYRWRGTTEGLAVGPCVADGIHQGYTAARGLGKLPKEVLAGHSRLGGRQPRSHRRGHWCSRVFRGDYPAGCGEIGAGTSTVRTPREREQSSFICCMWPFCVSRTSKASRKQVACVFLSLNY